MSQEKNTPLMEQYFKIKSEYPDTILFFQVGDFYELFFEDARITSSYLAIALTKRGKNKGVDVPLCGIPVHALNHYLIKMIKGGFKVAICDQITKPEPGKVVDRKVTQVFTPGTLTDSSMLDDKSASYLFSFYPGQKQWGLIFIELLTAQIFATAISQDSYRIIETELGRFFPDEIILPDSKKMQNFSSYFKRLGYMVSFSSFLQNEQGEQGKDIVGPEISKLWIENQFDSSVVDKLHKFPAMFSALENLYFYLKKNQDKALDQLKNIHFYEPEDYLILDSSTQKNLEIIKNNQDGSRKNSLFSILDRAKTAMGSRTIKKWLMRPLIQEKSIIHRQEIIAALSKDISLMQKVEEILASISDIERIVGRIALQRAAVNDYLSLKQTLFVLPKLQNLITENLDFHLAHLIKDKLQNFSTLADFLDASLNDEANLNVIIKPCFDLNLDELRDLANNGQQKILELEKEEIEKTKISSLKIRFNNISGYYIEITKPNLRFVPDYYIQQQTLVNRTRFVTPKLRELETLLLKAKNDVDEVEQKIFDAVKKEVEIRLNDLRQLAQALSYFDAIFGLADVAYQYSYVQPVFNSKNEIIIKNGRHPVVEQKLNSTFIPNDTNLTDKESLWILTGPNMGGKSTYLRQVALICIMAQCGSFVPADKVNLPILDRIFTRIGSGDNLAEGKSTFLVEMEETATICNQATKNSLVILDEVGRGTSTFDGMALAQSIVEYIFQKIGARTLFATHYHEITKLSNRFSGIANYHMESKKIKDQIVFLYKVVKGISGGSFGLEVAKLANLPPLVVSRAANLLEKMEAQKILEKKLLKQQSLFEVVRDNGSENDLNIFHSEDQKKLLLEVDDLKAQLIQNKKIIQSIEELNLDEITLKQAFDFLWNLKNKKNICKNF
ncbi:MAG: DNA mismatch repair protein MutS [bacterium]